MPGYPFAALERQAAALRAEGRRLFDLSIGDPDLRPPQIVLDAVHKALEASPSHRYPSSRGDAEVREAVARWYERRFGVTVDPTREVAILIGAKEGLAQLARAFVEPGDVVAYPDPGYPVYHRAGCRLVDGSPRPLLIRAEEGFIPHLDKASGARLLYLNYPHNPTGATADATFLDQLALLPEADPKLIVAYDMAYGEMTFDDPALSLLARSRRVVEFHSLSKMANATGYRIGFAVGHPDLIAGIVNVKEEIDSGAPVPFQKALAAMLDTYDHDGHPPEWMIANREIYRRRKETIATALESAGWQIFKSKATFYVWFRVGEDESRFAERALEAGVLLSPGCGFGSGGRGWMRASVTAPDEDIALAAEALAKLTPTP